MPKPLALLTACLLAAAAGAEALPGGGVAGPFPTVEAAVADAHRAFLAGVASGALDPCRCEYAAYVYAWAPAGAARVVHVLTPWQPAASLGWHGGQLLAQVQRPLAETGDLKVDTLVHSHPPGARPGPSWADLATASRYRDAQAGFRPLWLIEGDGRLVRFKVRRDLQQGGRGVPARPPRCPADWLD